MWEKTEGGYNYLFDLGICSYCNANNDIYSKNLRCIYHRCVKEKYKLITIEDNGSLDISLFSAILGKDSKHGLEKIVINFKENNFLTRVADLGLYNDKGLIANQTIRWNKAKYLMMCIPFISENGIQPIIRKEFNLELGVFALDKRLWIKKYQKSFEIIREGLKSGKRNFMSDLYDIRFQILKLIENG